MKTKGQSNYLVFPMILVLLVVCVGIITSMGLKSAEKSIAFIFFVLVVGFSIMVAWMLSQRSD